MLLPAVILITTLVFTAITGRALAANARSPSFTIDAIGHQFWWEIRYPDHQFSTANEIRLPVGQPVQIRLTSTDVIHSIWVPELHGKFDLMPGATNTITLQADQAGVYQGLCAEFCGVQHSLMYFQVIAEPPDQFAAWVDNQRRPAPEPVSDSVRRGQQVYLGGGCTYCHAIGGANAAAATDTVGSDLTHLASRSTIAAGALTNTRGNLVAWIVDPQSIKPGNKMPPVNLRSEDLNALLDYLESLE